MSARSFDINKAKKYGNVRILHENDTLKVRLHQTDVVILENNIITLNTNGWLTVTTKTAINNALRQLGCNISVFQKKGSWYVSFQGKKDIPFKDGMNIALNSSDFRKAA